MHNTHEGTPRQPMWRAALRRLTLAAACTCVALTSTIAQENFRLYHGTTTYVSNPRGRDFTISLELRDLNLYANGPREVLFKVYGPDGRPTVRETIPDDGVVSTNYLPRLGGWDHELDYYTLCYASGTVPMFRWSAASEPARLAAVPTRTFTRKIPGKKGITRILLVGSRDHDVTLTLDPDLRHGTCGHVTWLHGRASQWRKNYVYVPRGSTGMHLAVMEPDRPQTRRVMVRDPDGKVLFDQTARGGLVERTVTFAPGEYDDAVLTLEVSDGAGDYLLRATLLRPRKAYGGWGSPAVLCKDETTARALRGGALYADTNVYWHPWQIRYDRWLREHALDPDEKLRDIVRRIRDLEPYFRAIGPSDGRDPGTWANWAYAMGYYGFKVWRPCWLLSKDPNVPDDIMAILREACLMTGERLSFALGIERVNGNAFAQIPVHLWYAQSITGDAMLRARYDTWFERWRAEQWGQGVGISRSGDVQEHFAHDAGYGSYIVDNWLGKAGGGGTWVPHGILEDTDDPRFAQVFDRILALYSYLYCPDAPAYPWNSRIASGPISTVVAQLTGKHRWKGEPGPAFTHSVNDGREWFAARRKGYYAVTFHGRLAPRWLSHTFWGDIGLGGGALCQFTVPGKGTVLNSRLEGDYGKGMTAGNWRRFHVHSVVGELWDGTPFVAAASEHPDARLDGNVLTSSGEVRDRPLRCERRYTFQDEAIDCSVRLDKPAYQPVLTLWSGDRPLAHVREAFEMIPYNGGKVTYLSGDGGAWGELGQEEVAARRVSIDRGGYGVHIELARSALVQFGENSTILIRLAGPDHAPIPADSLKLNYRLVPFTVP